MPYIYRKWKYAVSRTHQIKDKINFNPYVLINMEIT